MPLLFTFLFRGSAEGDIKRYDSLCSVIHVHRLAELCIEKALLGGDDLKIVGLAIVHQFVGAIVGFAQHRHLTVEIGMFLAGGLTVGQGVIHLIAGVNDCLDIPALQVFLGELGNLVVGLYLSTGKDGLCELSNILPGFTTIPALFVHPAEPCKEMLGKKAERAACVL